MQYHLLGIAVVVADQSQLGQALAIPAGLKRRPVTGGLPIPGQHRTGDRHVRPEHRQLEVAGLLVSGQPGQADPDHPGHRSVPLFVVGDIQHGRARLAQLVEDLPH
jgi:hypothetical protein